MSACVAAVLLALSSCGSLIGADGGSTQSSGNDSAAGAGEKTK